MRDAVGNQVMRNSLPVGYVPPGKTLIQFWHLDFPLGSIDYNRPVVLGLLQEMLSVRRLSEGAGNSLGYRIYTMLPASYGDEGKVMAAMLLARARQAISEPETWPSLLDDEELRQAYSAYKSSQTLFQRLGVATTVIVAAPATADKFVSANPSFPGWLQNLGRGLEMFKARLLRQMAPSFRSIKLPDIGLNNRGKPLRVSGPALLVTYIDWILASGALQAKAKADAFSAEAFRRGVALQ